MKKLVIRGCALIGSFKWVAKLAGLNLVAVTSDGYTERDLGLDDNVINVGGVNYSVNFFPSSSHLYVKGGATCKLLF